MSPPPAQPSIYHITLVDNLASIIADGGLLSDAVMIAQGRPTTAIGMSTIKQHRLQLPVDCHPGDRVRRLRALLLLYQVNHAVRH